MDKTKCKRKKTGVTEMTRSCDLKFDLLESIHKGIFDDDDASSIQLFINHLSHIGTIKSSWEEVFCLDKYETTALIHTTPYSQVAKWRYEGWPDKCIICHNPLDYKKWHWLYYEENEIINGLAHIDCLPKYQEDKYDDGIYDWKITQE
jgi:hypothetical protein